MLLAQNTYLHPVAVGYICQCSHSTLNLLINQLAHNTKKTVYQDDHALTLLIPLKDN